MTSFKFRHKRIVQALGLLALSLVMLVGSAGLSSSSQAVSERGLENLIAFTRLLGYVRYFHPSDQASAVSNWQRFAVEGVKAVEGANTPGELAGILDRLFRPIAPTVQVFPSGEDPQLPSELNPPAGVENLQVVMWRHHGVRGDQPSDIYRSERVRQGAPGGQVPSGFHDPRRPYRAELGGGLSGLVPLALWADASGTFPKVPLPPFSPPTGFSPKERATRLAAVALAWSVFQHFYPYFDVVDTDWDQVLREMLTRASGDSDEVTFLYTLRRMVAQLHDGHGNVDHRLDPQTHMPRVFLDSIEAQIVVTYVASGESSELKPGDVVLKIDGRPAPEVLAEQEALISSATPQWRRWKALQWQFVLGGREGSTVTLEVQSQTEPPRSVTLRRTIRLIDLAPDRWRNEPRPDKIRELEPGVFYLDLTRITNGEFIQMLSRLTQAKGIIFDMRGYPQPLNVSPLFLQHLIDQPVTSPRFCIPIITRPDRQQLTEFDCSGSWLLQPLAPRLRAKVAFLTDARAISYAEGLMGIVENFKLGEIVGGPTAGTNGNINVFVVPGAYSIIWTGLKVLKHDGSRHHGVGILPTVPVARTIRGVREGRDELLERALTVVKGGSQ